MSNYNSSGKNNENQKIDTNKCTIPTDEDPFKRDNFLNGYIAYCNQCPNGGWNSDCYYSDNEPNVLAIKHNQTVHNGKVFATVRRVECRR